MQAYELTQRPDGRFEILDATKSTKYPIGATSWPVRSDAEFIHSLLNEAFANGISTASKVASLVGNESNKFEARHAALQIAATGREGWKSSDILSVAKDLEEYLLG